MISKLSFIWRHLVISSVVLPGGILLIRYLRVDLPVMQYVLMVCVMTFITIMVYLVMDRGIEKGNREGTFYLIAGIGIKFLLYLLFITLFWAFTKNLSKPFIIAFFLLYLTFTLLMVLSLLKRLKDR